MAIFRKCLPYLHVESVYSDEFEYTTHSMTSSFFVDKQSNFQYNTKYISIRSDNIMIGNYCIQFEYISHLKINNNSFYIFLYGQIKEDNQITYCDNPMFIKLIFVSHAQSNIFMKNISAIINKYKILKVHDNSATNFTSFKL